MKLPTTCYHCGAPATTREHVPPRSFFPRGEGLQLRTVPSCQTHNNDKSGDDQYLLTHIAVHASSGDNLAKRIFMRSVVPQLRRSPRFHASIAHGSIRVEGEAVAYRVDVRRFDNFFDHLCRALYFDRYGIPFDESTHSMSHVYVSLTTDDPDELQHQVFVAGMFREFFSSFAHLVESYDSSNLGEAVYRHQFVDPVRTSTSITIAHTFYGIFEVISLLTSRAPGVVNGQGHG